MRELLAASQRAAIAMVSRIALSHTQDGRRVRDPWQDAHAPRACAPPPVAPAEFYGKKSLNRRLV